MKKKRKPYDRMNGRELARATAEYDRPWTGKGLPGKPLTAADRAKHRRAGLGGRPKVGEGAKIVPISIERGLLRRADAFAKRHKLSRSQLLAEGLRLAMRRKAS
jgi:hypothetical protein